MRFNLNCLANHDGYPHRDHSLARHFHLPQTCLWDRHDCRHLDHFQYLGPAGFGLRHSLCQRLAQWVRFDLGKPRVQALARVQVQARVQALALAREEAEASALGEASAQAFVPVTPGAREEVGASVTE